MGHESIKWWLFYLLVLGWGVCGSWEVYGVPAGEQISSDALPSPAEQGISDLPTRPLQRVRVSQFQMGMLVDLTVWAPSRKAGEQAAAIAFRRVRALNQIFSDYEPSSELSRLCRQAGRGPVPVSTEFFTVLTFARQLAVWTGGLYDPTIGPVVRQWREARRTGKEPTQLRAAQQLVGYQKMHLNPDQQTVELTQAGMLLDLGSIAKGYAGDEALRVLAEQGIHRAAFEAGGDKVLGDPPPGESGWPVDLGKSGAQPIRLANCAVSISGDTVQYFVRQGQRMSHVINLRTGQGTSSHAMCIVIGSRGVLTDPLSTIGTLLPRDAFQKLLRQHFPQVRSMVFQAPNQNDLPPPRIPPP
ncbi:MAG: FAD:protein FMN transferase [Pirellulales bacterium]